MALGLDSSSDLADALKTAVSGPSGFLALALIVLGGLASKIVDRQRDKPALRYTVFFLVLAIALGGVGWSVSGHYSARVNPIYVPAAPSAAHPSAPSSVSAKPATEPTAPTRVDCGIAATGWVNVGGGVGDPCPSGCVRGAELGQSYRAVGFPPRPQTQHRFQCWRR
jgi:hypothetical protein